MVRKAPELLKREVSHAEDLNLNLLATWVVEAAGFADLLAHDCATDWAGRRVSSDVGSLGDFALAQQKLFFFAL